MTQRFFYGSSVRDSKKCSEDDIFFFLFVFNMWAEGYMSSPAVPKHLADGAEKNQRRQPKAQLLGLGNGPGTNRSVSPTYVENQVRASQRHHGALWTNKLLGFALKAQKSSLRVIYNQPSNTAKHMPKARSFFPPILPASDAYIINCLVCIHTTIASV